MTSPSTPTRNRSRWLWVTGPDYYANPDDSDHERLAPGAGGGWTCASETLRGDLILLYRTSPRSDIAYLLEATSNAYVNDNPGDFAGDFVCDYKSRYQFANPLSLKTMRLDTPLTSAFPAIRANFRRRSYAIDAQAWKLLTGLLNQTNPGFEDSLKQLET